MEGLSFIPLRSDDPKSCDIFRPLMRAYSAELAMHEAFPLTETETEKWIDRIIRLQGPSDRHLEICKQNGKPIGFFYGKIDHPEHRGYKKVGYGYIMEFYVVPESRRKGVGTAMYRRLELLFQMDGASRMYLTTNTDSGSAFWEAMGFCHTGEVLPENNLEILECIISPQSPNQSLSTGQNTLN